MSSSQPQHSDYIYRSLPKTGEDRGQMIAAANDQGLAYFRDHAKTIDAYDKTYSGTFANKIKNVLAGNPADVLRFYEQLPAIGGYRGDVIRHLRHDSSALIRWEPAQLAQLATKFAIDENEDFLNLVLDAVTLHMNSRPEREKVAYTRELTRLVSESSDTDTLALLHWLSQRSGFHADENTPRHTAELAALPRDRYVKIAAQFPGPGGETTQNDLTKAWEKAHGPDEKLLPDIKLEREQEFMRQLMRMVD